MCDRLQKLAIAAAVVSVLSCSFASTSRAQTAAQPDASAKAHNPVIWADVPDVAVIRVGDTYYMSSTTMHMSPGLPIMKSKDLVNWQTVSYAYDTLGDNDALTLANGKNAYGKGSWASSLRYHNGMFYVSVFSQTTGKTYVYGTKDPEKEPWKELGSFRPSLHDSSLIFDGDRVFMITGGGRLRLVELNPDFSGIKQGGVDKIILENASAPAGPNINLNAEGSQVTKIGNTWYLFNIVWPRGGMRTVIAHRAQNLEGPWDEGKVVLQDKGVAQGTIIDTPDNKWYGLFFRDSGGVGRIPYLVPCTWTSDGWPMFGEGATESKPGTVPMTLDIPAGNQGASGAMGIVASDEFDRKAGEPKLPLAWQWNHNPDNDHWSLTDRPGFLRITTARTDENIEQARNTLTQRTYGPTSSATTMLDVSHLKPGDTAGLAEFMETYGYVGVKATDEGKQIVMVKADRRKPVEVAAVPLTQNTVYLRVDCDFNLPTGGNNADKAYFYYSLDGKEWKKIGEPVKMEYRLTHFMGSRFALFNFATKTAGGYADFDYYRTSPEIQKPAAGN